jgi:putative flippase GtrA
VALWVLLAQNVVTPNQTKKRHLFRDTCVHKIAHQGLHQLATEQARPLRFILTGSLAGLSQIGLLAVLLRLAVSPLLANGIAFLLAAQLNFLLSLLFTWRDRHEINRASRQLLQRWLTFHGSILGTAILNQLIFALTQIRLPALLAAGLGIVSAAIANFFLMDRLVFRPSCQSQKRKDIP